MNRRRTRSPGDDVSFVLFLVSIVILVGLGVGWCGVRREGVILRVIGGGGKDDREKEAVLPAADSCGGGRVVQGFHGEQVELNQGNSLSTFR